MNSELMAKQKLLLTDVLRGRERITPEDLPPFGARVRLSTGQIGEVMAWYGPHPGAPPPKGRVAIVMVLDGATPDLPEGKTGFITWVFEVGIVEARPQRWPRFAQAYLDYAILTVTGLRPDEHP